MPDHETAMLVYVKLAAISQQKRQQLGRDKLLILAAATACKAGWLEVAARCRELVLSTNRSHLIGNSETFADALRDPEFQTFLKQLERFCPYEKAEHLLKGLEVDPAIPPDAQSESVGEYAIRLLKK